MTAAPRIWPGRTVEALRRLSSRPSLLFAVLWAVSAVTAPYFGFYHDAKLYGMLVLNRTTGGAFADDLFLRFGSQDRYSPFSALAAPLARSLGLEWTFFLLFVVFNALLVYAMQRLVSALIDDRVLAAVASLFLVMAPLPYGGLRTFQVHEAFFTPRVGACALALFALEQSLRARHGRALALAATATVIHPLMGFGALLVAAASATIDGLPRRALRWLAAAAAGVALTVVAVPSLATRIFGTMDAEWVDIVRAASPYNFPGEWTSGDWLTVSMSLVVPLAAALAMRRESPRRAVILLAVVTVAVLGLVATVVAVHGSYRVLLQGQPYRTLWVATAIRVPLTFWLAERAWHQGVLGQVIAVALIGLFGVETFVGGELVVLLLAIPLFVVLQRGMGPTPRRPDWLVRSLQGAVVVGVLASVLIKLILAVAWARELLEVADPLTYVHIISVAMGPLLWLVLALAAVTVVMSRRVSDRLLLAGAVALAVVVHGTAFVVPRTDAYQGVRRPGGADVGFVAAYLARRPSAGSALPTLYAGPWGLHVEYLWIDLGVKSYYDLSQIVGVIFSRETAVEGARRGAVVRGFEMDRYRSVERFAGAGINVTMTRLFRREAGAEPPTRLDLARLCRREEGVDVAVLRQDFSGLASASNGRVSVYECAQVRALVPEARDAARGSDG